LIDLADKELEVKGNQQTIKDLTQKKDDLQIQLDLATKTKEQLAQELAKEK
ncbi:7116_t:CDS:1, partial [Racocetra persica]